MFKVIIHLYEMGRYVHIFVDKDNMLGIADEVRERYGTTNYNIVSVHNAEPEEQLPEDEPISRRITLYAVGENFKDALQRGHIRQSKTDATDVLRMVVRDSPDTVTLGLFGFDVYVDENSNHWNA